MPTTADPIRTLGAMVIGLLLVIMLAEMVRAWFWAFHRLREGRPLLPEPEPRPVPWGLGTVMLVLFSWVALNVGIANAYIVLTRVVKTTPGPARSLTFTEKIILISMINAVSLALVPALIRATSGARLADLGVRLRGLRSQATVGTVAFLLITPIVYAFNILASLIWKPLQHPLEMMVRTEFTSGILPLALLSAVVLAPAAEELIFRGIIQSWLVRAFRIAAAKKLSPPDSPLPVETLDDFAIAAPEQTSSETDPTAEGPPASTDATLMEEIGTEKTAGRVGWSEDLKPIALTSAFFAIVHLPQWPAPIAIFFLSLGLGIVYQRSGSLVASFVMHALFNTVGTLLLIFSLALQ